jgi:hypothetical protein
MVSVNETVDCFAGPSEEFDKVAGLETGTEIQVVGQSDDGMFWIVAIEDGNECWLVKENTTVTIGEVSALPLVIPPATPTLGPPAAPSDLTVTTSCDFRLGRTLEPTFVLMWKDNSNNEDGYVIYKDGFEVKRLGVDATKYSDGISFRFVRTAYQGPEMIYAVTAFNTAGESASVEIGFRLVCPK